MTFAYDADGLRTEKHQFNEKGKEEYVVYYIWQDGILTHQYLLYHVEITSKGTTRYVDLPFVAEFLFDDNNQAQGCIINGEVVCMFVRNMQGDMIALTDEKGNILIEYNYDPWGRITCTYLDGDGQGDISQEELQMITAIFCPLTYRGYNYDFTTGLYYLQSRYYNPDWGRFLNCDDTSILQTTVGTTHGANMFAYCNNNPVNRVDYTGYAAEDIGYGVRFAIIVAIFGAYLPTDIDVYSCFTVREDKEEHKGLITVSIDLTHNDFYEAVRYAARVDEEITYTILTSLADQLVQDKYGRPLLFSWDCMYYEIQWHVEKFILSKMMGDVYDEFQPLLFKYNAGIRNCYYSTSADPYVSKSGNRSKYRVKGYDNTPWESELNKMRKS